MDLLLFSRYNDLLVENRHISAFFTNPSLIWSPRLRCSHRVWKLVSKNWSSWANRGENRTILRSLVLTHYQSVTDRQTDRHAANSNFTLMAITAKTNRLWADSLVYPHCSNVVSSLMFTADWTELSRLEIWRLAMRDCRFQNEFKPSLKTDKSQQWIKTGL